METPADPPVTVSGACERALPPPESSKQEAGPQYHTLSSPTPSLVSKYRSSSQSHHGQRLLIQLERLKVEHRKAQPLKDGLKGIKEKTIHVLFGKQR